MLWSMGSRRVRHDLMTKQQQQEDFYRLEAKQTIHHRLPLGHYNNLWCCYTALKLYNRYISTLVFWDKSDYSPTFAALRSCTRHLIVSRELNILTLKTDGSERCMCYANNGVSDLVMLF